MRATLTGIALFLAATTVSVTTAHAAPDKPGSTPANTDEARSLFEEGTELLNAGRFAEAAEKLRRAWDKKRSYDVAGNLGTALLQLGQHLEAARMLSFALENFPAGGSPKERKWVEDLIASARKEVALVRVQVSVDGAEVYLNGERIGVSPLSKETFASAGKIVIEAKKDGFESSRDELQVSKGDTANATVTMRPKKDAPPLVPERPKWPGYVAGGVGLVGLAVGGALLGVGVGKNSEAESKVPTDAQGKPLCSKYGGATDRPGATGCDEIRSLASTGQSLANAGLGVMIGGGGAVAVGAVFWLWPDSSPKSKGARTLVVPLVATDGGGVVLQGAF